MAQTGDHAQTPSLPKDMSTENGGDPGQTSTGATSGSASPTLSKSKSQLQMESHAVEEGLLKELWFAKFIVRCPCALCWIMFGILFLLLIIIMQIHTFSADDLAMTNRSFSVDNDHYTEYYDAYTLASEYVTSNDTDNETLVPQTEDIWSMTFYFTHKNYDDDMSSSSNYWIMDKENIELMIEYENMIMEDDDWLQKYCYAGDNPLATNYSCSFSVSSVVRAIYENSNYSSWSDDDIRDWIGNALPYVYWYFNPDVDKYDDGSFDDLQIYRVRSFFSAGGPFATNRTMVNNAWVHTSTFKGVGELAEDGYTREGDEYDEQSDMLEEWAKPLWDDITLDEQGGYTDGDLNIIFIEDLNYVQAQLDQVNVSFIFFALAVIVVQMYMSYHLHSCCLGCGAMLQILLSFVLGFFWYRVIFWIDYTDFFTILVIFVLLGIGAVEYYSDHIKLHAFGD